MVSSAGDGEHEGGSVQHPKPAWPLFLLAAFSFVPGFGFFFGAAAATWGLLSARPRALWAAALAGAGVLLQVVVAVVVLGLSRGSSSVLSGAMVLATQQDLVKLVQALDDYHERRGTYPANLADLQRTGISGRFVNIYDQAGGVFRMPRLYRYVLAPDGAGYDVFSAGPDREPGTADDIRPRLPDSLLARTGYRPRP